MDDHFSVREWQQKFKNGEFNSADSGTQINSGWYDWFCDSHELPERLKELADIVMKVTDPFILDNYYLWFCNNCPGIGDLYDDIRFEPLSGQRNGDYFLVSVDSPYETARWALYTQRNGYDSPEMTSEDANQIASHIDQLGADFAAEKQSEEQNYEPSIGGM